MASNNLHAQWVAFCKRATPGARFWLNDDLFERLIASMRLDLRYTDDPGLDIASGVTAITFRGGYEHGGLSFYRRRHFPNPPRRAPGRQEFYAR